MLTVFLLLFSAAALAALLILARLRRQVDRLEARLTDLAASHRRKSAVPGPVPAWSGECDSLPVWEEPSGLISGSPAENEFLSRLEAMRDPDLKIRLQFGEPHEESDEEPASQPWSYRELKNRLPLFSRIRIRPSAAARERG